MTYVYITLYLRLTFVLEKQLNKQIKKGQQQQAHENFRECMVGPIDTTLYPNSFF